MNVICDDSYALSSLVDCFSDWSEPTTSYTSCILVSTYHTLVDTYNFLIFHLDVLSKHDTVFFIGTVSIKKIIKNIAGVNIIFIDAHCSIEVIKEKLSENLHVRLCHNSNLAPATLTIREYRDVDLLIRGHSPSNIAKRLSLNPKTISSRKRTVMKKYGVTSTMELIMKHSLNKNIQIIMDRNEYEIV